MRARCLNPRDKNFSRYGGRGIGVDERWSDFNSFLEDMGERPNGTTLDRIDNSKGYSKENCRWATIYEQNNNQRSNVVVAYAGNVMTAAQAARLAGLNPRRVRARIRESGWSADRALSTPVKERP